MTKNSSPMRCCLRAFSRSNYLFLPALLLVLYSRAFPATFSLGPIYGDYNSHDLAVADLNHDGKLDFIVAGPSTMVYLGNGDGTFTFKWLSLPESFKISIGDLNGDKIPDFVISNTGGVEAFIGKGDGSFQIAGSFFVPNFFLANPVLGDFNHDGKLDLAIASTETNQVLVLLGKGDGTFGPPAGYTTGIHPQYSLAVDLNGDGNLDLVVGSSGDIYTDPAGINILLGNSDGTFGPRSFIQEPDYAVGNSYYPAFMIARDFDGDGNPDLLLQGAEDGTTYILYGAGDGTFAATAPVGTDVLADNCVVADFNGDSKPDIVCSNAGLTIVTNSGNRNFSSTTWFPAQFRSLAAGDFNRDGKMDLLGSGGITGDEGGVYVYLNSPAATNTVLSVDQTHVQYGQLSHLQVNVGTAKAYNTGCFSTCPAGNITWSDNGTAFATTTVTPAQNHSGTSAYAGTFAGGMHTLSAGYMGEELPSTSNIVSFQVLPAPPTLAVLATPPSAPAGSTVTIAVAVSSVSSALAIPTGTVSIQENNTSLANLPLDPTGHASIASLQFSGGVHTLEVHYSGDANYSAAAATTSLVVQPGAIQLSLACSPNPAAANENVSCVARASHAAATGTVTLSDGAKVIGSGVLDAGQATLQIGPLAAGMHSLQASYSGDSSFTMAQSPAFPETVTSGPNVTAIAAADGHPALAPQAIGSIYGTGFTDSVTLPNPGPLPTTLGGLRVMITDTSGAQQPAPLFFVSPQQINFLTPNLAPGQARVQISNAAGMLFTGPMTVQPVSPALFSANSGGKGVAAAYFVHVSALGAQSTQLVFTCGSTPGSCSALPLDLGGPSDQNFLILYGSGTRNAAKVAVLLGGENAGVVYFGAQTQFAGLDQINVQIPSDLAGRGTVHIALTADGQSANDLVVDFK